MSLSLYDWQLKALNALPKNVILSWDTGTGKSLSALEHVNRHNPNGDIVVVAPASKVREGGWSREVGRYYGDTRDYTVISYEMFTKKWGSLVSPTTTLILDEIHFAQHPTTLRSKAIIRASKVAHQWVGLSATALPNGWRSAATYAILTGLSRNKTDFWRRFVIEDRSRGFPLVLGYREQDTLNEWWRGISSPLKRTGDLELPSEMIPVAIDMSASEKRVYKTAMKERVLGNDILDTPSKLFSKLRQLPVNSRVEALKSILDGTDEHVVVFYNFNSEREAILHLLSKSFKERKVYEQSGHRSELPSRDKWSSLKPSVTLVQYQSGSAAIELTYASITVYFSPTTSYSNYEQSIGRTKRAFQTKTTLFYHISVNGALDLKMWLAIKEKKTFSDKLIRDMVEY